MKRLATVVLAVLAAACGNIATYRRQAMDPIVVVHGPAGDELAVSTDYGVVFLGRSARSGRVEFSTWFGDGPSLEEGVVQPVGGGLFATESEITIPTVPLAFSEPKAGTVVLVRGRRAGQPFEFEAALASDPRVKGVLLVPNAGLAALTDAELGTGVFLAEEDRPLRLLGLISGKLELDGQSYVTAVGPEDLWRLVVYRRNTDHPRRWVYREDLL